MPTPPIAPVQDAGPTSVDAPSGEYVCSDSACRRRWRHDGGSLRHDPVQDGPWVRTPRRWHPCPSCVADNPVIAGFAHDLRRRTAADLLGWAESVGAE